MSCLRKLHYILGLCLIAGSLQGCLEKTEKRNSAKNKVKTVQVAVVFQSGSRKDQHKIPMYNWLLENFFTNLELDKIYQVLCK